MESAPSPPGDKTKQDSKYIDGKFATQSHIQRNEARSDELRASIRRKLWRTPCIFAHSGNLGTHIVLKALCFLLCSNVRTLHWIGMMTIKHQAMLTPFGKLGSDAQVTKTLATTRLDVPSLCISSEKDSLLLNQVANVFVEDDRRPPLSTRVFLIDTPDRILMSLIFVLAARQRKLSDLPIFLDIKMQQTKNIFHLIMSLFISAMRPFNYDGTTKSRRVGDKCWYAVDTFLAEGWETFQYSGERFFKLRWPRREFQQEKFAKRSMRYKGDRVSSRHVKI